jgi:hypothetical protein
MRIGQLLSGHDPSSRRITATITTPYNPTELPLLLRASNMYMHVLPRSTGVSYTKKNSRRVGQTGQLG